MNSNLTPAIHSIMKAFQPSPIVCLLNGKMYFVEKITDGWCWRNEDGDCQEDFGIEAPFSSAAEAQQDAIRHVHQEVGEAV
jgi:hypothetical protein